MSEQTQAILAYFGPVSASMAGHILIMNLLAPAAVLWAARISPPSARCSRRLASATVVQLLLLWGWHAPPLWAATMDRPVMHLAMQTSLAIAALWFWNSVVSATAGHQWRAIAALLSTSKLFCLLGVLLTFAAHPLYPATAHHGVQALDPLADQQVAGLMMLTACPLSYLVAAVALASRWLESSDPALHPEGAEVA
jgi:putative membrane protein